MIEKYNHTPCFLCSHIFEDIRPILYVSKADGDWQFLCGQDDHEGEIPRVVGINHIFERDKSVLELEDLPDNYEANRSDIYSKWVVEPCEENLEE